MRRCHSARSLPTLSSLLFFSHWRARLTHACRACRSQAMADGVCDGWHLRGECLAYRSGLLLTVQFPFFACDLTMRLLSQMALLEFANLRIGGTHAHTRTRTRKTADTHQQPDPALPWMRAPSWRPRRRVRQPRLQKSRQICRRRTSPRDSPSTNATLCWLRAPSSRTAS